MGFFVKGAIATVVWFVVCFVGFQWFFSGPTSPEEDARISQLLGQVGVMGLLPVWGAVWALGRGKS